MLCAAEEVSSTGSLEVLLTGSGVLLAVVPALIAEVWLSAAELDAVSDGLSVPLSGSDCSAGEVTQNGEDDVVLSEIELPLSEMELLSAGDSVFSPAQPHSIEAHSNALSSAFSFFFIEHILSCRNTLTKLYHDSAEKSTCIEKQLVEKFYNQTGEFFSRRIEKCKIYIEM